MGQRGPIAEIGSRRWERARRNGAVPEVTLTPLNPDDRPAWLKGEAAKTWDELVPRALADGLPWSRLDAVVVAAYCSAVALLAKAERNLARRGMILRTPPSRKRPDGREYENPAIKVAAVAAKRAAEFAKELGLSPTARQRLDVTPRRPEVDDAVAQAIFG